MAAAPGLRGPGCGASGRLPDRPQVIVALFTSENPTDRGSLSGRDRGHDNRLGKRPDMGCLSELRRSLVRHPGCQFHVDRYHRDGSVLLDRLAIHIKRFAQDTSVLVKSALPGLRPPARRRHAFGARNDLPHLPVSIIHETFTDRQWLELREPLSTCAEDLLPLARLSHGFSSRRVGDAVRATARSPRRARSGAFVAPDQARQGACLADGSGAVVDNS